MSLLIRGMEMPRDGTFNIVYIYGDGHIEMPFWGKGMQTIKGVTAVRVPPHGDLIDRDAIRAEIKKHATPSDAWVFSFIRTAPTIIPASEEGK